MREWGGTNSLGEAGPCIQFGHQSQDWLAVLVSICQGAREKRWRPHELKVVCVCWVTFALQL